MSRFGPTDPFYARIAQAESDERIARFAAADAERYRVQMAELKRRRLAALTSIVDSDPGDEDDGW